MPSQLAIPALLALGEACGFATANWCALWPAAAFAALMSALLGHALALRHWRAVALFLAGMALAFHATHERRATLREATETGRPLEASLFVEAAPRLSEGRGGKRLATFPSSYSGIGVRVVMSLDDGKPPPQEGETWHCAGWLERRDTDDFRHRRFLWVRGRGTFARRETPGAMARLRRCLAAARRNLSRRLGIGLAGPEWQRAADLNRAMLLGERSRLERSVMDDFAAAGTLHVFAISGLHVMAVARVMFGALVLMLVPVRLAGLMLLPVLWLYVGMVGAGPSAVRAAAMASIYFLAPLGWRRPDSLSAWAATFIVFHAIAPMNLLRAGSLLSCAVMLGILLFMRWAREFSSRTLEAMGMSLAAWAAGVPIVAHFFGQVTPGGIAANLLLVPAAAVAVGSSLLAAASSVVSTTLAAHFNCAAALVARAMAGVSWAVARTAGANFSTRPWPLAECVAWYAAIFLALWLVKRVWRRRAMP